jgi:disulfide bond formation protein DsbB
MNLPILTNLSSRAAFFVAALVCAGLLGTGYFLEYFQGQDPCPLCYVQRFFYYGVLVVSVVAGLHAPAGRIASLYGAGALVFAAGGLVTAGRHVWLQHLPAEKVPACGPDLMFMLENLPFSRAVEKLFAGAGQCAEVKWRLIGLSIAEWSLLWFAALTAYAVWVMVRRPRSA